MSLKSQTVQKKITIPKEIANPIYTAALECIKMGYSVIPCDNKVPIERVKSVNKLRERPINEHNCSFYFVDPDQAKQIALLTGKNFEVIDVDVKYDLTGKLHTALLLAIKYALPEVYEKLVIVKTASNGLHLYYKCFQIGGNKPLAHRNATPEERAKGERKKVLIETRGEGGYIIAPPSPGYEFNRGSIEDVAWITPEERSFLLAICRSFDLIIKPELKGISKSFERQENAPWNVFNKEHDYQWIIDELTKSGWEIGKDDEDKVMVLRPGSEKKSSGAVWKESGILYLFSTSTEFESEKPYSAFGVCCQLHYDGDLKACAKDLADQGYGQWSMDDGEFYFINPKGKVEIKLSAILQWLKDIGYYKYRMSVHDFEIINVIENKVAIVSTDFIKKTFGDYIKSNVPERIYDFFLARLSPIFSKDGLLSQLDDIDEKRFVKSSPDAAFMFYQNTVLRITSSDIQFLDYSAVDGYVWEKNIIKRTFRFLDGSGDASEFISIVSGRNPDNETRFRCVLGYLLHPYKDPVNPKAIILNDEFYDDENDFEPQGGTGKGLFIQLTSKIRNTYSVDGKRFSLNKNFPFQGITPGVELFVIEDAVKGFDFEPFFSSITENLIVEKKGKDEFVIPFDSSPKVLITTNYAIKGSSSSHVRRRYEIELTSFFSHKYSPIDYFKKRFFIDWDEDEWSRFDNYMALCLQMYLQLGLPAQVTVNLAKKKLIQETNRDFVKWIEEKYSNVTNLPPKVHKDEFMKKFTDVYPDYAVKLTQAKFTRWVVRWCEFKNIGIDTSNNINGKMAYGFITGDAKSDELFEKNAENNAAKVVPIEKTSLKGWEPHEGAPDFDEETSFLNL